MNNLESTLKDAPGHNAAVKIFICHNIADIIAVEALVRELKKAGYTVWWFEKELQYGDPVRAEVEQHIRECDFFLLCYSRNSVRSRWVREELDLALSLKGSEACQIQIYKLDDEPLKASLRRRSWQTGRERFYLFNSEAFFDCTKLRCFNPSASFDSLPDWIRSFAPRWSYYGYGGRDGDAIPDALFDMLDDLFDDDQRSHREDWRGWITDSCNNPDLIFRDLIVSISIGQKPIGFISLTPYVSTGLVFGNYFGVLKKHRSNNYAQIMHKGTSCILDRLYDSIYREGLNRSGHKGELVARPHGYLFEVEPLPASEIEEIIDVFRSLQLPRDARDMHAGQKRMLCTAFTIEQLSLMRAAKRVALYERAGCLAFVDNNGAPLPYVGPGLRNTLTSDTELQYVLMYSPLNTSAHVFRNLFSYRDILHSFYFDWYADGNAKNNPQGIPGYLPYLQNLYEQIASSAPERFELGSLQNGSIKKLLDLDRRYKVSGAI